MNAKTTSPWPSTLKLRAWQQQVSPLALESEQQSFLISATPGAGKTIPALYIAQDLLRRGEIERVVVVAPTRHIARQWAKQAHRCGLSLEPNLAGFVEPADCDGVAVTYQRVAAASAVYRHGCQRRTLVIADEPHHLGEQLSRGEAFFAAFEEAERWLLLTGTPFRSDAQRIPGVSYDQDGVAEPDFSYTYPEAIRDGVCRKVAFVPYEGEMRWAADGEIMEATFVDALDHQDAARRHRTSLNPGLPEGLPRMLVIADKKLGDLREDHADAGGLVVAMDIAHAKAIGERLSKIAGESVTVVTSDDKDASAKLDAFRQGPQRWVVAVNMISEGVDIPRLRVGVYATVTKTPLAFRQIIGRFVRVLPDRKDDLAYVYLPGDPALRALAEKVESEIRHQLVEAAEDPASMDPDSEEIESTSDFTALRADVHVDGALLSGVPLRNPDDADAVERLARSTGLSPMEVWMRISTDDTISANEEAADGPAGFEVRDQLRRERHRLVGRLHHLTNEGHREISARINGACGVVTIKEATVEQLERSIGVLNKEINKLALTGSRRP
jgi:superfamily II DNA or RNA helicase